MTKLQHKNWVHGYQDVMLFQYLFTVMSFSVLPTKWLAMRTKTFPPCISVHEIGFTIVVSPSLHSISSGPIFCLWKCPISVSKVLELANMSYPLGILNFHFVVVTYEHLPWWEFSPLNLFWQISLHLRKELLCGINAACLKVAGMSSLHDAHDCT